jgi:hypothetical protein
MYRNSFVEILEAFKDISIDHFKTEISNAGSHLYSSVACGGMELPFDVLVAFNTNLTEGERNARLISLNQSIVQVQRSLVVT